MKKGRSVLLMGVVPLLIAVCFALALGAMMSEYINIHLNGERVAMTLVGKTDEGLTLWTWEVGGETHTAELPTEIWDTPVRVQPGWYLPEARSIHPGDPELEWGLVIFLLPFILVFGAWGCFFLFSTIGESLRKIKVYDLPSNPRAVAGLSGRAVVRPKGNKAGAVCTVFGILFLCAASWVVNTQIMPRTGTQSVWAKAVVASAAGKEYRIEILSPEEYTGEVTAYDMGGPFTEGYLVGMEGEFYYHPGAGKAVSVLSEGTTIVFLFLSGLLGVAFTIAGFFMIVTAPRLEVD